MYVAHNYSGYRTDALTYITYFIGVIKGGKT